jgi:hypothetical protein
VAVPPLAVAAERPGAAGVGELETRDVAGEGAAVLGVEVLAADLDAAAGQLLGHRGEEREGGEDGGRGAGADRPFAHPLAPGPGFGGE